MSSSSNDAYGRDRLADGRLDWRPGDRVVLGGALSDHEAFQPGHITRFVKDHWGTLAEVQIDGGHTVLRRIGSFSGDDGRRSLYDIEKDIAAAPPAAVPTSFGPYIARPAVPSRPTATRGLLRLAVAALLAFRLATAGGPVAAVLAVAVMSLLIGLEVAQVRHERTAARAHTGNVVLVVLVVAALVAHSIVAALLLTAAVVGLGWALRVRKGTPPQSPSSE